MKIQRGRSKLRLGAETVRALSAGTLAVVAGGIGNGASANCSVIGGAGCHAGPDGQ